MSKIVGVALILEVLGESDAGEVIGCGKLSEAYRFDAALDSNGKVRAEIGEDITRMIKRAQTVIDRKEVPPVADEGPLDPDAAIDGQDVPLTDDPEEPAWLEGVLGGEVTIRTQLENTTERDTEQGEDFVPLDFDDEGTVRETPMEDIIDPSVDVDAES